MPQMFCLEKTLHQNCINEYGEKKKLEHKWTLDDDDDNDDDEDDDDDDDDTYIADAAIVKTTSTDDGINYMRF
uniref:Uncharacterized protein n=1 Tax=Syphacia muris TaxID=451379 RepID=A0A0N5B177_9BILA